MSGWNHWMYRRRVGILVGFLILMAPLIAQAVPLRAAFEVKPRPLPDFPLQSTEAWLNTTPLKLASLRGKVLLIEVWTSS